MSSPSITPETLTHDPTMRTFSGDVTPDTTTYTWADGTPVSMEPTGADGTTITALNVNDLSSESFEQLQTLYSTLLSSSEKLASQELWHGIQTRIFAQADQLIESEGTLALYIKEATPPVAYDRSFAAALNITPLPLTVGEQRKKPYTGQSVLLSGGVNNFIIVREQNRYAIKLLTLTRNVISNDGKTPLADASKAQSPGGGRLENAAALPQLAIDETAEEVRVRPSLTLTKALINLPQLNPTCVQVYIGESKTPVAQFFAHPFIDTANNTLECYANALHFIGDVELAEDQHAPDRARLSNGKYLYRSSEALLLTFDELRALAQKNAPHITPNNEGIIDAAILDHLEEGVDYIVDKEGNYSLVRPLGLTPQLNSLTENARLMQWFQAFETFINTPQGGSWVEEKIAHYTTS